MVSERAATVQVVPPARPGRHKPYFPGTIDPGCGKQGLCPPLPPAPLRRMRAIRRGCSSEGSPSDSGAYARAGYRSRGTRQAPRPCVKAKRWVPALRSLLTVSHSVTAVAKPVFSTTQLSPPSVEASTPRSVPR